MSFNAEERKVLGALADELIPAGDGMPSATEAGVAGEGLDRVLMARPELEAPLRELLGLAGGREPAGFLAELQERESERFGLLAELVAGAYFLNEDVRSALEYSGQGPIPIDPHPDWLDDGLLQSVLDRGPVYRPTPRDGRSGSGT